MKKQKKILLIISIIMLVIITGIIILNNVTYAYMTNEQANTIFTGNAEIKSITNYHIATSDGSNYEISLDELNTVCSKGGTVESSNGAIIQTGRYQEICDVYINLEKPTMAKTIMSLAIPESQVNSSTMTKALIKDSNNDYRYIGKNPDNYVTFNGETWRIIGVFNENTHGRAGEQLVKIIRDESLGLMSWDYKKNDVGSSTSSTYNYGSNDWSDSQLMYMLNGANYLNSGYTTGTTPIHNYTKDSNNYITDGTTKFYQLQNGSSYLDGATSVCKPAIVASRATFSCSSLTVNGINAESRAMIEEITWKLGFADYDSASNGLASHLYSYERGTAVYSGRPTTWKGKIGLMYPSDYGYATIGNSTTNRTTCLNKELYGWNSSSVSACKSNDWLFDSSTSQYALSPISDYAFYVHIVYVDGCVKIAISASDIYSVRPVLYLKSSVSITGGSGTEFDPYTLSM